MPLCRFCRRPLDYRGRWLDAAGDPLCRPQTAADPLPPVHMPVWPSLAPES